LICATSIVSVNRSGLLDLFFEII